MIDYWWLIIDDWLLIIDYWWLIIDCLHTENAKGNGGPQADFVVEQQLSALASAWWAPLSINNKRIIRQQLKEVFIKLRKFLIIDYWLFTHYIISAVFIKLCKFLIIDYWLLMIDYWWLMIDDWLLMTDDWWLIIDYWLLIIDYW